MYVLSSVKKTDESFKQLRLGLAAPMCLNMVWYEREFDIVFYSQLQIIIQVVFRPIFDELLGPLPVI